MPNNDIIVVVDLSVLFSEFDAILISSNFLVKDYVSVKHSSFLRNIFAYFTSRNDLDMAVERYIHEHILERFYAEREDMEADEMWQMEKVVNGEIEVLRDLFITIVGSIFGELSRLGIDGRYQFECAYLTHQYSPSNIVFKVRIK